jgi:hypothetical protein
MGYNQPLKMRTLSKRERKRERERNKKRLGKMVELNDWEHELWVNSRRNDENQQFYWIFKRYSWEYDL